MPTHATAEWGRHVTLRRASAFVHQVTPAPSAKDVSTTDYLKVKSVPHLKRIKVSCYSHSKNSIHQIFKAFFRLYSMVKTETLFSTRASVNSGLHAQLGVYMNRRLEQ